MKKFRRQLQARQWPKEDKEQGQLKQTKVIKKEKLQLCKQQWGRCNKREERRWAGGWWGRKKGDRRLEGFGLGRNIQIFIDLVILPGCSWGAGMPFSHDIETFQQSSRSDSSTHPPWGIREKNSNSINYCTLLLYVGGLLAAWWIVSS